MCGRQVRRLIHMHINVKGRELTRPSPQSAAAARVESAVMGQRTVAMATAHLIAMPWVSLAPIKHEMRRQLRYSYLTSTSQPCVADIAMREAQSSVE